MTHNHYLFYSRAQVGRVLWKMFRHRRVLMRTRSTMLLHRVTLMCSSRSVEPSHLLNVWGLLIIGKKSLH